MIPTIPPFVPTMYGPNNRGRYRQYPRNVVTPIPGAGVDPGGKLVWAEQEIDLDGNNQPYGNYGNYAMAPLRGLGTIMWMGTGLTTEQRQAIANMSAVANPPQPSSGGGGYTASVVAREDAPEIIRMPEGGWAEPEPEPDPSADDEGYGDRLDDLIGRHLIEQDPGGAEAAVTSTEEGFFDKKLGPVPLWAAVGGGALLLVGGGIFFFRRRR